MTAWPGPWLWRTGVSPIVLGAKEGLALINGTDFSTAGALTGVWAAWRNAQTCVVTAALSTDAIMGSTAPLAMALAEIGAIAQRRVALMVDPTLIFDLPPFLTPEPGLNSGLMIAEVSAAALMSENKHLANTTHSPRSARKAG